MPNVTFCALKFLRAQIFTRHPIVTSALVPGIQKSHYRTIIWLLLMPKLVVF
jgi:hypothetical protein